MIEKFEVGKYYAGILKKPEEFWTGDMKAVLDGKPRKCTYAAIFPDVCSDGISYVASWEYKEYTNTVCAGEGDCEDSDKSTDSPKEFKLDNSLLRSKKIKPLSLNN